MKLIKIRLQQFIRHGTIGSVHHFYESNNMTLYNLFIEGIDIYNNSYYYKNNMPFNIFIAALIRDGWQFIPIGHINGRVDIE